MDHPNAIHTNADPVLAQAVEWLDEGRRIALATVTRTWGSAPRRAGSHMAIAANGDFSGSVSGGCVEGAVIQAAIDAIGSGEPRTLEFGVTDEMAWEVGLACGGRMHVFVEPVVGESGGPRRP
ncbi:MAG: XdhC family protein [Gemmatimonadota bacterium]|nr:XdhC family protein [Gemmatimonadota bacterium]